MALIWLRGLLRRSGGRLAATALGVAAAVALLASLGSFLAASKAAMTTQAIQRVGVDWQVQVQAPADPKQVLDTVRHESQVDTAAPLLFADTTGLQATVSGATLTTGPGKILGLTSTYASTFPAQLRYLTGAHTGVLLAQQTASNLHAAVGDVVQIGRAGLPAVTVKVDGVVDLPQADALFQKVGALPGAQPQAPPDNVLLLPDTLWHQLFDPLAKAQPNTVATQVHVKLRHQLPADPAAAYTKVTTAANHLESKLAGGGVVGDNLAATLGSARQDALYAQVLFLFLGVPGAVLAAMLTAMIASSGATRRRGEQALLRARGATAKQLLRLAGIEAAVVGVVGAVVGLAAAALTGKLAFGSYSFGSSVGSTAGWLGLATVAGLLIALTTVLAPARRDLRETTVVAARRSVGRASRAPRWQRYGVDFILLAGSGLVFWATAHNGYQLVLAPEGVPAISVNYWAFAGPALLWVGGALLIWRLVGLLLTKGHGLLTRVARPLAGPLAGTVASAMRRQSGLVTRIVVVFALAGAFAASTATFDATYRQQARADALLTNGADVTVTQGQGSELPAAVPATIAAVPGVGHVEPMLHRFAYVGSDLQDLYGVHPETVRQATALQDAYFIGGTATSLIAQLGRQPDAILVSQETVKDFQLQRGDLIQLRLHDAKTQQLVTVPFHYVGIVKEFPTAPRDSFFIANASYVASVTHSAAIGEILVTTNSKPTTVAARLRDLLGPTARVTDIVTSRQVVGSSLTAVDLTGLSRVELAFAVVFGIASSGLLIGLSLAERRRTLLLTRLVGARRRQVGGFVWSEAIVIAVLGLAAAALLGAAITQMLVKVLTGVFDPPPAHLAVPWGYLVALAAAAVGSLAIGALSAVRSAMRTSLSALRA
ncbi:MAG: putative transport system permease protein [Actinomycetota bacterium]|nr:putative transport system permease protein [Actinomycetota bacterium]